MKIQHELLALLGVTMFSQSCWALDGNALFSYLKSGDDVGLYYVAGVVDGLQIGDAAVKNISPQDAEKQLNPQTLQMLKWAFGCRPTAVTYPQIADVVKRYLEEHPESRHKGASFLVAEAIYYAWPCEAKANH